MIAAAHLDNFLFLIFFAVAILFQLLARAANKARKPRDGDSNQPSNSQPVPRQSEETEEDRVRKFLEALGQPTTSNPPPPARPRTDVPPRPVAPVQPPASMRPFSFPTRRASAEAPRTNVVTPRETIPAEIPTRQRKPFAVRSEIPAFEVQEGPPPLAPITTPGAAAVVPSVTASPISNSDSNSDLLALLKSPSGLRNAIILREIFGPPRSLQPLDLVGNG